MVYFCPEGGGERGREREREGRRERERHGPTVLDRQQEAGRRGFSGVRKVTEAERSFVFVLIKT